MQACSRCGLPIAPDTRCAVCETPLCPHDIRVLDDEILCPRCYKELTFQYRSKQCDIVKEAKP